MFCDQCGIKPERNSKFCDNCGALFEQAIEENKLNHSTATGQSLKESISVHFNKLNNPRILSHLAITAIIITIGGISFSAYQNYQAQIENSSQKLLKLQTQLQEVRNSTGESFTVLKEENQKLKTESRRLQATIRSISADSEKQKIATAGTLPQELLNKIMPRIVKVNCVGGRNSREGSGFIPSQNSMNTRWEVYTNLHVTRIGDYCTVSLPTGIDFLPTKTYTASLIGSGSYKDYPEIDFAKLVISDSAESFGEFPIPNCNTAEINIGDRVTVLGYPGFGRESLTVTDGIVSGIDYTTYGPIYKTSAKIDEGNSGGFAIDNNKKCSIGIPTWASSGAFEGLGYIQSWEMIEKSGNL